MIKRDVKPFVKWAGGKSQIISDIRKKLPRELGKSITKYCEPFLGGGAVLFDILSTYSIDEVLINDITFELINAYKIIQSDVDSLIAFLMDIENDFLTRDTNSRKDYYYQKRERFNMLKPLSLKNNYVELAALFIFLNKTCFNGLYRVNKSGQFNVPIGSYKKPLICDENNLIAINKILQNVQIINMSYQYCECFIDDRTFVYIYPPYRPISSSSSFISYNETLFDDNEQINLAKFIDKINKKGAKVIASNSDPQNTNINDNFFDNLYKDYNINRILAKRMINSNSNLRGNIKELLILNF